MKKFLALAVVSSLAAMLNASTVKVSATADNDFIVVLTNGNSHTVKYRSNDRRDWKRVQHTKFEVSNSKRCYIDIIAWGDHKVKEGLAARVQGNAGSVYSGQTAMKSYATKVANSPTSWAANGYPNSSLINNIYNALSPSPTANLGSVVNHPTWGSFAAPIGNTARWIWAAQALNGKPLFKNFTMYRVACKSVIKPQSNAKKGMTWRKVGKNPTTGVVDVDCGYSKGKNECNPYKGDTPCTKKLPILCTKVLHGKKPAHVGNGSSNGRHAWSGNLVHTSKRIAPALEGINTIAKANRVCVKEFGKGWRVAEFHDARQWGFRAYGNIGNTKRFWVDIKDQPNGNCWTH